jgi:hypothetical protein
LNAAENVPMMIKGFKKATSTKVETPKRGTKKTSLSSRQSTSNQRSPTSTESPQKAIGKSNQKLLPSSESPKKELPSERVITDTGKHSPESIFEPAEKSSPIPTVGMGNGINVQPTNSTSSQDLENQESNFPSDHSEIEEDLEIEQISNVSNPEPEEINADLVEELNNPISLIGIANDILPERPGKDNSINVDTVPHFITVERQSLDLSMKRKIAPAAESSNPESFEISPWGTSVDGGLDKLVHYLPQVDYAVEPEDEAEDPALECFIYDEQGVKLPIDVKMIDN